LPKQRQNLVIIVICYVFFSIYLNCKILFLVNAKIKYLFWMPNFSHGTVYHNPSWSDTNLFSCSSVSRWPLQRQHAESIREAWHRTSKKISFFGVILIIVSTHAQVHDVRVHVRMAMCLLRKCVCRYSTESKYCIISKNRKRK